MITETREKTCPKHGVTYTESFYTSVHMWNGHCPICLQDEALERQARDILIERNTEYERQVAAELSNYSEQQILEHAESELSADLEKWRDEFRPQYVASARAALHEQIRREVEHEHLERIKEELRTAEKASVTA